MFVKIKNVVYNTNQIKYIRREVNRVGGIGTDEVAVSYSLIIIWADNTSNRLIYETKEEALKDLSILTGGEIND